MTQRKTNIMKVAFLEEFLNIRGTSVALYDYAHYNETILGNQSIILTEPFEKRSWHHDASIEVQQKFRNRFPVFTYENENDIRTILDEHHVEVLNIIKSGRREGICDVFPNVKTIIHVVFDPVEPHGDVYCVSSDFLNQSYGTSFPVLPRIVHLPETDENFRDDLGIPHDAIVYGRYGGLAEFDVDYAQRAVARVSHDCPNIYFMFMNTPHFIPPSRNVFYFRRTVDSYIKAKFVNTCDAMIYGRRRGETFGLAIGEFSSKNKPILAPRDALDKMHQMILGEDAIWYTDEEDCYQKMKNFKRDLTKDWNMYEKYCPQNVMTIFDTMIKEMMIK